ncbi:MAG TPA: tetratricopeptide repeat protein, partial [Candidatus Polarisedimenticolia bacterium]|nr:tetratricopeptide repeat protein [Candidatus Polarisedimenticolia bacterium]
DVGSIAVPGPVPTPASSRARLLRSALLGGAAAMLLVMTPVVAWWTDRRAPAESGVPAGAFEHYLRGRHLLDQGDPAALEGAVGALERAVAVAPDFARAHLALAGAYARLPGDREVAVARSRRELRRAIELDDGLAAAHAQLADILLYNDWNFDAAEESLRRAITLQPDSAEILHARANFLSMIGRHDEAIEEIRRAMALDPVSAVIRADAAWYFYRARRYDEAIAVSRATLEVEPDNQGALWSLLQSRRQLGQSDAALDAARRLQAVLDPDSSAPAELADFWRWYLAFNERGGLQQVASPSISGLMHLALGERERALDLFELATERRIGCVLTFAGDPQLDPIRDDPRFAALLNRMRLTG